MLTPRPIGLRFQTFHRYEHLVYDLLVFLNVLMCQQGVTADVYYRGGTVAIWGIFSQSIALWISAATFLPIFYKLKITSVYEVSIMLHLFSVSLVMAL